MKKIAFNIYISKLKPSFFYFPCSNNLLGYFKHLCFSKPKSSFFFDPRSSNLHFFAFCKIFKQFSSLIHYWASSRENMSSGFPRKRDSNQPAQLQRMARKLEFRLYHVYNTRIRKALNRLRRCENPLNIQVLKNILKFHN